jgi:membrane protease YdiL (CAAX protease family)
MIFPTVLALIFIVSSKERLSAIGWKLPRIPYWLLSIVLPIVQMGLVVAVGYSLGLLSLNRKHLLFSKPTDNLWLNLLLCIPAGFIPFILFSPSRFLVGWINHLGEEFAWRGYLFRKISQTKGNLLRGVLISGAVWWAWHIPLFWLSPVLAELNSWQMSLTFLLSFLSLVGTAATYSWVYLRSGSIWAPTMMHLFWNLYRGILTGRLADGEPGVFSGNLWIVNGEGMIGMIVTAAFGIFFFFLIIKMQRSGRGSKLAEYQYLI